MKTKSGREYELKDLTLTEREHCNNHRAIIKDLDSVIIENSFTITIDWIRFGLISLDGEEINKENREAKINSLSDDDLREISGEISSRTALGVKKKS